MIYHNLECEIFKESKATFQHWDENEICLQLDCVTPLRFLINIEHNQKQWKEEISLMEFHDEARRLDKEIWEEDQVNVVNYINKICDERFEKSMIERAIGVLVVNAFEARTEKGYLVRCLYPKFGVIAHSCIPNTSHSILSTKNFK